jgi:hypothetical protein
MLISGLVWLLISCLLIFGRHGITFLVLIFYWSRCEGLQLPDLRNSSPRRIVCKLLKSSEKYRRLLKGS